MSKTYIYKLKSKYKKHPEVLLHFGFNYYESEGEEDKVTAFVHPLVIKEDNPLFIQAVRFLEHIYEKASSEEREKDFKDFKFERVLLENQETVDRLVLDDNLRKQFSEVALCVSLDKNAVDSGALFIQSPLEDAHYNYQTLELCAPELIKALLEKDIIYAKRYFYNPKR